MPPCHLPLSGWTGAKETAAYTPGAGCECQREQNRLYVQRTVIVSCQSGGSLEWQKAYLCFTIEHSHIDKLNSPISIKEIECLILKLSKRIHAYIWFL